MKRLIKSSNRLEGKEPVLATKSKMFSLNGDETTDNNEAAFLYIDNVSDLEALIDLAPDKLKFDKHESGWFKFTGENGTQYSKIDEGLVEAIRTFYK